MQIAVRTNKYRYIEIQNTSWHRPHVCSWHRAYISVLISFNIITIFVLTIGPKRGAQEGTTISKETFSLHLAYRSYSLDQPDDEGTIGAAGGTSKKTTQPEDATHGEIVI